MFNVKFCSFYEDGSSSVTGISCQKYNVYKRINGTHCVTTYKSMVDDEGIERSIMTDEQAQDSKIQYYHSCYIENSAGKTVEHIR